MKPFVELNLHDDPEKATTPSPPKQEGEEIKPLVSSKKLNRLARKAAHRAALDSGRGSPGLFSK